MSYIDSMLRACFVLYCNPREVLLQFEGCSLCIETDVIWGYAALFIRKLVFVACYGRQGLLIHVVVYRNVTQEASKCIIVWLYRLRLFCFVKVVFVTYSVHVYINSTLRIYLYNIWYYCITLMYIVWLFHSHYPHKSSLLRSPAAQTADGDYIVPNPCCFHQVASPLTRWRPRGLKCHSPHHWVRNPEADQNYITTIKSSPDCTTNFWH